VRAVLAHWAYYLYSGVTFFFYATIHFIRLPFSSARKASVRNS
jgi:hypothetical protein